MDINLVLPASPTMRTRVRSDDYAAYDTTLRVLLLVEFLLFCSSYVFINKRYYKPRIYDFANQASRIPQADSKAHKTNTHLDVRLSSLNVRLCGGFFFEILPAFWGEVAGDFVPITPSFFCRIGKALYP